MSDEMKHIVSLSGGVSSALAAERVINRYGRDAVTLWFADTSWEDPDLHRFMRDCMARWGGELVRYCDGRTPLEVAEDHHIIPNSRIAPCTFELKIQPFVKFLATVPKPLTVHLGLDWSEMHRMEAPKRNYEAIEGVTVDYPLMWKPYEFRNYFDVIRSEWGIETPDLYRQGWSHNNCGGRCVKQGQRDWRRLLIQRPADFAEVRDWEQDQRAKGGPRADFAILRSKAGGVSTPITLLELEKSQEPDDSQPTQEDMFACFCSY
jgi:hypothetical protein